MKRLMACVLALSMMAGLRTRSNLVTRRPIPIKLITLPAPQTGYVDIVKEVQEKFPPIEIETKEEEKTITIEDPGVPTQEITYAPSPSQYYVPDPSGSLSPQNGVFNGPSGTERYYNLDMSGVVASAKSQGIEGEYWVREDGVKMYGSYIICACGFSVRPRGTVVETSLGPGICLDTGGFAANDPYMIDIACDW